MKAVVLKNTGNPEVLTVTEVPIPTVKPGWVLIKVKAFGLNRSELMMRQYEADAPYIQLPRILGIECVGIVSDASDSHFAPGQKVVALMGGMGRSFDGSYAEYALVPTKNVFSVNTDMSWEQLAAIPETYFTAYGSLFDSLQLKSGDSLLIRGGSSSAGLAAIQLARSIGAQVLATTRKEEKRKLLLDTGADHALIENGSIREQVKQLFPGGVTKVLELIGPSTLYESMSLLQKHGIVCVTGILGKKSTIDHFYPIKDIPSGVYLTGFVSNSPTQQLIDSLFEHIKINNIQPTIARFFTLEQIAMAHALMENNEVNGKIVVVNQQ
jgi:NADPH2:quinone reductase